MKKTSYIIIALAILPLVLVFLSPFIGILYADTKDDYRIDFASSRLIATETTLFNCIAIDQDNTLLPEQKQNIIVRHGPACRILVPEVLDKFVSYAVNDNRIDINIENIDNHYRFVNGDTLLIIETPDLKNVVCELNMRLIIDGFTLASEEINFDGTVWLNDCRIDSLSLNDAYFLRLNGSHVNYAAVTTNKSFEAATFDGRIDYMKFTSTDYSTDFTYTDANIGMLRLEPDNGQINVYLKKPITINNDDNGSDD